MQFSRDENTLHKLNWKTLILEGKRFIKFNFLIGPVWQPCQTLQDISLTSLGYCTEYSKNPMKETPS